MKNKNSIVAWALIGFVIGALTMGLLDATQPKPLFSSAMGCEEYWDQAIDDMQALVNYANSVGDYAGADHYAASVAQLEESKRIACAAPVQQPPQN